MDKIKVFLVMREYFDARIETRQDVPRRSLTSCLALYELSSQIYLSRKTKRVFNRKKFVRKTLANEYSRNTKIFSQEALLKENRRQFMIYLHKAVLLNETLFSSDACAYLFSMNCIALPCLRVDSIHS